MYDDSGKEDIMKVNKNIFIRTAEKKVGHRADFYFTNYRHYLVYKRKIKGWDWFYVYINILRYWYCPASDPKRNVVYMPNFWYMTPFIYKWLIHELLHLRHPRWSEKKVMKECLKIKI